MIVSDIRFWVQDGRTGFTANSTLNHVERPIHPYAPVLDRVLPLIHNDPHRSGFGGLLVVEVVGLGDGMNLFHPKAPSSH